jgi:YgiT-type zinc finger domain-containing protein
MSDVLTHITLCPTCGSDKINKVRRNWTGKFRGKTYTVPALEFYECPNCGERIYDPQAVRKIEAHSPAFAAKQTEAESRAALKAKAA